MEGIRVRDESGRSYARRSTIGFFARGRAGAGEISSSASPGESGDPGASNAVDLGRRVAGERELGVEEVDDRR